MILTEQEVERYARQVVMPEIGEAGQKKLLDAKVLILGAGGLGAPVIAGLAGAGIGYLTVIDDDVVELTNLNRQITHSMDRLGMNKAESATLFSRALNPDIQVHADTGRLGEENADVLIGSHDLVVDCTDNSETRYLVNRICHKHKVPLVFAGAVRTDGQITCFLPDAEESPCLRCIFPQTELDYDQAPSCSVAGVLGPTTLIMGALQTAEAIKLITQTGTALIGRLLLYDGLSARFTEISVQADPACPVCGKG
tara:strand:+ start:178 stop:939 length:762 start_codon:yes stop_codon:yes gene_type:complete